MCSLECLKSLLHVLFAVKGSDLRREEEQAYVHFVDFLDECSGMKNY